MIRNACLMLSLSTLIAMPSLAGLGGLEQSFTFANGTGKIDYSEGYIEATATGTADVTKMRNSVQAESVARRTARHLAYEVLAETVGSIQIDAKTLYKDAMVSMDALKVETHALIRGAMVVSDEFEWVEDPMTKGMAPKATVTVRLHLTGEEGLVHLLDKHLPPGGGFKRSEAPAESAQAHASNEGESAQESVATTVAAEETKPAGAPTEGKTKTSTPESPAPSAPAEPQATAEEQAASGKDSAPEKNELPPVQTPRIVALVIDSRSLEDPYQPALRAYVRDKDGNTIYGPELVKPSVVIRNGYIRYAASPDAIETTFGSEGESLLIKAVDSPAKGEVTVTNADSKRIAEADGRDSFLREGHVLLVVE